MFLDEVLPATLRTTLLQVNEVATAAVGFMIHGDALITQSAGLQHATTELLSEVQASLNQLSTFSNFTNYTSAQAGSQDQQPQSAAVAPTMAATRNFLDTTLPSVTALNHEALRIPKHHRQNRSPANRADAMSSQNLSRRSASCVTDSAEAVLFQPPDLPGLRQQTGDVQQDMSVAQSPCITDKWGGMQSELLGKVLQQLHWTSKEAIALTAVCR